MNKFNSATGSVGRFIGDEIAPLLVDTILAETQPLSSSFRILSIVSPGDTRGTDSYKEIFATKSWKRLVVEVSHDDVRYVVKFFSLGSFKRRVYYDFLVGDPLARSFRLSRELVKRNIETPPVLSYGYLLCGMTIRTSFQVMHALNDYFEVSSLAVECLQQSRDIEDTKSKIAFYLASELARTHNSGFYHLDIKPDHLFTRRFATSSSCEGEIFEPLLWIDLEEAFIQEVPSLRLKCHTLRQMWRYFISPLKLCSLADFIGLYNSVAKHPIADISRAKKQIEKEWEMDLKRAGSAKYRKQNYYGSLESLT